MAHMERKDHWASILFGAGCAFDVFGVAQTKNRYHFRTIEEDAKNLRADGYFVVEDLRYAYARVKKHPEIIAAEMKGGRLCEQRAHSFGAKVDKKLEPSMILADMADEVGAGRS